MKKLLLPLAVLAAAFSINAQTQPANGGMETWGATYSEPQEPTNWVSANILASPLLTAPNPNNNPTSVTQYTPAFAGSFSAQIKTVVLTYNPAYPSLPDTMGALILGAVTTSTPYLLAGHPYTDRPNTFMFESMYTPVSDDSAWVYVQLSKWSGSSRTIIAQNIANIPVSGSFSAQSFVLSYLDMTTVPDTLQISFYSSKARRHGMRPGSILVVDGIGFSGFMGINEYKNDVKFNTYPNPAGAVLNISTDSRKVDVLNIYDITGKAVDAFAVTADRTQLNTGSYAPGMYFYCAANKAGEIVARGKFNVTR
jgi:hypothetical protein